MRRIVVSIGFLFVATFFSCTNDNGVSDNKPTVATMKPAQVSAGQANVKGKITGSNFKGIVAVDLGAGVSVQDTTLISETEISVLFSVNSAAAPGPRTVKVATSEGIGSADGLLSVSQNQLPIAKFSVDPANGSRYTNFEFDAGQSSDPDGKISDYSWNFGDNQTANGKVVNHKFSSAGNFNVMLTVTDNHQGKSDAQKALSISNAKPPSAHFDITPKNGGAGTDFTFDGSRSEDDGHITNFKWTFDGGGQAEGKVVHHQFGNTGDFGVNLTVTDNDGLTDSLDKIVTVRDKAPVAKFAISPSSGTIDTTFKYDASESYDPDGTIAWYTWDFGDGSDAGGVVAWHKYSSKGSFTTTLYVKDTSDVASKTSHGVTVSAPDIVGTQCTTRVSTRSPDLYGTITQADQSTNMIWIQLYQSATCATAFYKCGDVKLGGDGIGGLEQWYGTICQMWYVGNNTFKIRVGGSNKWPSVPTKNAYLHWQICGNGSNCQ